MGLAACLLLAHPLAACGGEDGGSGVSLGRFLDELPIPDGWERLSRSVVGSTGPLNAPAQAQARFRVGSGRVAAELSVLRDRLVEAGLQVTDEDLSRCDSTNPTASCFVAARTGEVSLRAERSLDAFDSIDVALRRRRG